MSFIYTIFKVTTMTIGTVLALLVALSIVANQMPMVIVIH